MIRAGNKIDYYALSEFLRAKLPVCDTARAGGSTSLVHRATPGWFPSPRDISSAIHSRCLTSWSKNLSAAAQGLAFIMEVTSSPSLLEQMGAYAIYESLTSIFGLVVLTNLSINSSRIRTLIKVESFVVKGLGYAMFVTSSVLFATT